MEVLKKVYRLWELQKVTRTSMLRRLQPMTISREIVQGVPHKEVSQYS